MNRYLTAITVVFLGLVFAPLNGQTQTANKILTPNKTSGAELNRVLEQLRNLRLEHTIRKEANELENEKKSQKKDAPQKTNSSNASLELNKVEFSDSVVFSKKDLQEIVAKYIGTTVSMKQIEEILAKINNIYNNRGFITAMAILPPQKIKNGVLNIRLIEGKIGSVMVGGNKTTDTNYILNRVNLPKGQLLSIKSLNKDLQWFNGTNDIKLRIKLQAGTKPGETDYLVFAYEPKPDSFSIFSDTAGSDNTGRTRTGISYTNNSISGIRDSFSSAFLRTKTSKSGIFNYTRPINTRGTKLGIYYSLNDLTTNTGLTIEGKSNTIGVTLSIPQVIQSRKKEILTFDFHKQRASNKIFGMNFVDDDENRFSISKAFYRYAQNSVLYLKPSLSYCAYDGLSENRYFQKFNIDGMWQNQLTKNHYLNIKVNGQRTDAKHLPSTDLFYLGGQYSIRGYNESVLGGDSGLSIKVDYICPTPISKNTQFFVFYDWGKIYGKSLLSQRILNSAGFGLNHTFVNNSFVSLTIGYPFVGEIGQNVIVPQKVDFALNITF